MNFYRISQILQTNHNLCPNEWKGAVLFLCNEEYVFLIKRSESMPTHAGQMAFFGGLRKPSEIDPWEVAQREFEEETSLKRENIKLVGYLPVVMTAHLQSIVPILGKLLLTTSDFFKYANSNGEWDEVIAYPWTRLLEEDNWEYAWRNSDSRSPVLFHPICKGTYIPLKNDKDSYVLWGATASIIWSFFRLYFRP